MYTANRLLSVAECKSVQAALSAFRASWAAHGSPLRSESAILLNQVVVLAVDEEPQIATGCSIDASVAALRSLNETAPTLADLDVLDRSWVVYKEEKDAPEEWKRARLHDFWAMRKAGTLTDDAQILDSTLTNLGSLRKEGVKRLADSWHAHMW